MNERFKNKVVCQSCIDKFKEKYKRNPNNSEKENFVRVPDGECCAKCYAELLGASKETCPSFQDMWWELGL